MQKQVVLRTCDKGIYNDEFVAQGPDVKKLWTCGMFWLAMNNKLTKDTQCKYSIKNGEFLCDYGVANEQLVLFPADASDLSKIMSK